MNPEHETKIDVKADEIQGLKAKIEYLEVRERENERELNYLRGMVDGLKYSLRCNGVSGGKVGRNG